MTSFRWWMVVPAGFVAWFATLIFGLLGVGVLDSLCPPELVISGQCTANWYSPAVDVLMTVFAGLSAIAVVVVPTLVAPSRRRHVAVVAYSTGAAFALYFVFDGGSNTLIPVSSAIICGWITLLVIWRVLLKREAQAAQLHQSVVRESECL